jgi:hypothetical protein
MRKQRLRGMDKLNWLKEQQDVLTNSKRYAVVSYKGIPLNIQRQGFNPSHVASQKRTRAIQG